MRVFIFFFEMRKKYIHPFRRIAILFAWTVLFIGIGGEGNVDILMKRIFSNSNELSMNKKSNRQFSTKTKDVASCLTNGFLSATLGDFTQNAWSI